MDIYSRTHIGYFLFLCVRIGGEYFFRCPEEQIFFLFKCLWRFIFYRFQFLLIPLWGIWGAVLSVVLSFMVMSVSRVAYSWTYVKLTHIPRLLLMLLLTCIYIVSVCLTGSANSLVAGFITIGLLLLLNCDLLHLLKRKIIKRYIAK